MSEKLDGIRAYWNGKKLLTRQGKEFNPPVAFIKNFPPFELDGELWSKRADFENIQSHVLDQDNNWAGIKYMIFEVPHAKGNFFARLKKAREYITKNSLKNVKIIEQKIVQNKSDLNSFLELVIDNGGEGVIVKDASKDYFEGRSSFVLKVKKAQDMEAKVIGYKAGSGKFTGMMGSLQVELENGVQFFVGSGFSKKERKNPPKTGEVVTFKYFGFTKYGKPKFASFMRVRKD